MGYGLLHGNSSKQKINIKSSIDSELGVTCKYLPYNVLLMMFMEVKEYGIRKKNGRLLLTVETHVLNFLQH